MQNVTIGNICENLMPALNVDEFHYNICGILGIDSKGTKKSFP